MKAKVHNYRWNLIKKTLQTYNKFNIAKIVHKNGLLFNLLNIYI